MCSLRVRYSALGLEWTALEIDIGIDIYILYAPQLEEKDKTAIECMYWHQQEDKKKVRREENTPADAIVTTKSNPIHHAILYTLYIHCTDRVCIWLTAICSHMISYLTTPS